jgi:CPA1 family monovalent cation:H+ antiporter
MHTILPFFLAMIAAIVLPEYVGYQIENCLSHFIGCIWIACELCSRSSNGKDQLDLIFFIFLPPLLFEAAWSISFKEMKRWWRIIGSFAFLVVFLQHWLLQ